MQSAGRLGETALLRLPARPSILGRAPPPPLPRARWRRLRCPSSARPPRQVPSRLGPRGGVGWGVVVGGAQRAPTPPRAPRPRRRPWLPSPQPQTAQRGSSGRVLRAVRRDGWRLPVAGPLACPTRPAAGPGPVCLSRPSSAALGLPRGRQTPPHALRASGLAPGHPSPRLARLSCVSPSHLCRVPARLAPRFPSSLPLVVEGGGCLGRGRG